MTAPNLLDVLIFEAEAAERLETLGANLAIAGALCRAFDLGWYNSRATLEDAEWSPGCGKDAP